MTNKNVKMLLFVTLCILLIGIVSASDIESNDTIDTTPTISEKTTETIDNFSDVKDNVIDDNKEDIKKDTSTETLKTATNTIGTKISIDYVPNVSVDDGVLIMGKFTDVNNNPLRYTHLKVDINGEAYYSQTDDYGDYFGEYLASTPGTKTITVSWAGNARYAATSAKRTFNVEGQYPTKIVLNTIKDVNVTEYTTISGYYYYDQNKPLRLTTMTLNINGAKYYTKTDNNGYFTYNYKTSNLGTNTITVSYPGNTRFEGASTTKTFNVKYKGLFYTYIKLNNLKEVNLGEYTTISGYYYYDQNKPLRLTTMTLNINGAKYYTKTDNNGYFTYNYKTTKAGTNTITVSYPGNTRFKEATETKTFNVKSTGPQYTYITLNNIKNVEYGEYTTISGYYYYDQNKPLRLTTMTLNINGAKYYTKTDNNGYFTYNYKTNNVGTNNLTVSYPGNANFKAANATKTFNVTSKTTKITIDPIESCYVTEYTEVFGKFVDIDGNPLRYTTLILNINGNKYSMKTLETGEFHYVFKPNKAGTNNVSISFAGNQRYKAATSKTSFNVKKQITEIFFYNLDDAYQNDIVLIRGEYFTEDYIPLKYTPISVTINGNKYTTKTDEYGDFYYYFNANNIGKYTITVSYPGNENFYGDSYTSTLTVKSIYDSVEVPVPKNNENVKYIDGDVLYTWYQTIDAQYDAGVHIDLWLEEGGIEGIPLHTIDNSTVYYQNNNGKITTRTVYSEYGEYAYAPLISGYTPYKAIVRYHIKQN